MLEPVYLCRRCHRLCSDPNLQLCESCAPKVAARAYMAPARPRDKLPLGELVAAVTATVTAIPSWNELSLHHRSALDESTPRLEYAGLRE